MVSYSLAKICRISPLRPSEKHKANTEDDGTRLQPGSIVAREEILTLVITMGYISVFVQQECLNTNFEKSL
uniref:Uncharacterized protein n=1 Tax=Arion vulgaris TaxID=1028688 RepID=A0A0B6YTA1_9EUPU